MRTLLATLLIFATAGAANAYCVAVPDNAESGYVRNGEKRTICINNELADQTARKNREVEIDTTIGRIQRDQVLDKLDAIKPVIPPPYTFPRNNQFAPRY